MNVHWFSQISDFRSSILFCCFSDEAKRPNYSHLYLIMPTVLPRRYFLFSGQIPGYPLSMLPLILHHKAAPVHCAHNPACPAMRIVSLFILGFGDYGAYWCTMGAAHQNHSCEQLLTPTQTSTELSSTRHKRQTNLCQLSGKID